MKPFCVCQHSYWSHRVGRYDVVGRIDYLNGKLRDACERQGCRCISYQPNGRNADV